MLFSFNAARHKSELLAKAIIASSVRMKIRAVLRTSNLEFDGNALGVARRFHCHAMQSCYAIFSQNPRRFGIFGKTSWPS